MGRDNSPFFYPAPCLQGAGMLLFEYEWSQQMEPNKI